MINKITDQLINDGKLIEAGWVGLKAACFPDAEPSALQEEEMRNAFFAGAQHLLSSIMNTLDPGSEPTDADLLRLVNIEKELRAFILDFQTRRLPVAGSA